MKCDWPRMKFRSAGFSIFTVLRSIRLPKQSPVGQAPRSAAGRQWSAVSCDTELGLAIFEFRVSSFEFWDGEPDTWIQPIKRYKQRRDNDERERAAVGTDRPAGEPPGAMKRRIEQVSGDHGAAVGHRVDEAFRIVPRGVQPDGKPQAAGASHGEAKEEPDQTGGQPADPGFARVGKVDSAEERRKQHGRGPESDSGRERVERVAAKEELFREPHEQKGQRPENDVGGQFASNE